MTPVFVHDRYFVAFPTSFDEISRDAHILGHMSPNYIPGILRGECQIAFMRHRDTIDTPLLTLLVKSGKVVEARGLVNREPTREEQEAIDLHNSTPY
jgi:hypothetical protein